MDKIIVEGGCRLEGEVFTSGAKNAALPILAATLLTDEPCVIENVPLIEDTRTMAELLSALGASVHFEGHSVFIEARQLGTPAIPADLARRMRASFLAVGPLLARLGQAASAPPGGCAIGKRPVNVDTKGMALMGAEVLLEGSEYRLSTAGLHGAKVYLDYPSHTGTENLLMAACLADGVTILKNASAEPEVSDLAAMLIAMGANIRGAGSSIIEVRGVPKLHGARYRVMPDRIEAGTFAIASAITHGDVTIRDIELSHMDPVIHKLLEVGAEVQERPAALRVKGVDTIMPVEVQTLPYPGFPTDLQAAFGSLLTQADGTSIIHERVYDNRLLYASEMSKMGADIAVSGQTALIRGPVALQGTAVRALDIRAGAALVLAALAAAGPTEITDVMHLDRGYEDLVSKLRSLGALISRSS